ncbi:pimeloyl-[acyl-carrier protein] methyl ester esterase, partial [Klebsiella pneumoniae]|nr:pimeloyl-[acyl-carrier protein] methyl ester esterase [Klebsiella pneumoniae]
VPRKVAELLDAAWPNSASQIVAKAAHAPFISHPDEFVTMIEAFIAAH